MKSFIKNNGFYFLGVIILIFIWQITSIIYQNDLVFPSIINILKSIGTLITTRQTYSIFFNTIFRLIIAFVLSLIVSIALSIGARKSTIIKQILTPLISLIKSTPVASSIIIILIIFGHQKCSIVIAFLMMLPIQYEGFYNAFNSVDSGIKDEVKTMTDLHNKLVVKEIILPIVLPGVLTTFLQSFSLGIKSLVMAELLTMPKNSIGAEMLYLKNNLDISGILAWTVMLTALALVFEILINNIKNRNEKEDN